MHKPFPFRRLQALALMHLRIGPRDFWRMTPRELFSLLGQVLPPPPPDHDMLVALMKRFPDEEPPHAGT